MERWRDPYLLAAGVLVLLPPLAAAISALRHPWVPSSDWAHIETEVRAVGTADTPLVGATSRFQWHHPGPLPFYALALPYRLVPPEHGLLFAAAVVNLVAVGAFAVVVARQPRIRALLALLGLAIVERGLGIDDLTDPWNPTLPLMPFALYLALCLEVATSDRRWPAVTMVGVGSFVIQAHLALTHPVVALGTAAFLLRVRRLHRERYADKGGWRRLARERWPTMAIASGVGWLAWTPPLLDQFFGDGNISKLVRFSLGEDTSPGYDPSRDTPMSWEHVPQYASWLLEPTGLWMGRATPHLSFGSPLLVGGSRLTLVWIPVVLAGAYLLARFGRLDAPDCFAVNSAVILAATGVLATFTALPGLKGTPVYWPFRWVGISVMAVWLALAWAVAEFVKARVAARTAARSVETHHGRRLVPQVGAAILVAVVAYPVVLTVWRGSLGAQPFSESSGMLLQLQPTIERLGEEDAPVTVYASNFYSPEGLAVPVLLERAGIPWIDGRDPAAARRPRFEVLRGRSLSEQGIVDSLAVGDVEVAARATSPAGDEIVLLRWRPAREIAARAADRLEEALEAAQPTPSPPNP